ncbi:MAG: dienelactone hydrolase family protein [Flavobacteriales bacterium]|nr:dienelactone hydrolase family protein [Flavobacteriales bacterium]
MIAKFPLILLTMLAFQNFSRAQTTCCNNSFKLKSFHKLAKKASFKKAHVEPLYCNPMNLKGTMISFPTQDGKSGRAYHVEAKETSNKALFLFHEWWGLNSYIQQEADRFSEELPDMHIYAVDLYDSAIATTRENAAKLMSNLKQERAENIIRGLINHVGKEMRIATLGWCLGGGWSLQASIIAERQSRACVMFYGMPEKNINRLQQLTAPVLFIAAEKDAWITPDIVMNFAQTMSDLKKNISVINYAAEHAFANPSNPHYDKEKALDAFRQAIDFIKMHF